VSKVQSQISVVRAFMGLGSKSKVQQVVELHRRRSQDKGVNAVTDTVATKLHVDEQQQLQGAPSPKNRISGKFFPKLFKNEAGSDEPKATYDNNSVKAPGFNTFMPFGKKPEQSLSTGVLPSVKGMGSSLPSLGGISQKAKKVPS
jgi:hypothetical protein